MKKLFGELVYGGHLFAFSMSAIVYSTIILMEFNNVAINLICLLVTYFSTRIVYLYNYNKEVSHDTNSNPERVQYINKNISIFHQTLIANILLLLLLLLFLPYKAILLVVLIIFGGITYTDYLKRLSKYIPFFKNLFTPLLLSFSVLFIPVANNSQVDITILMFALFVFIKIFLNNVFFDIKDIDSDLLQKIKTIPVIFGKQNTIKILNLINVFSVIYLLCGNIFKIFSLDYLTLILFSVYDYIYLQITFKNIDSKTIRNLSYIVSDGEYLLWPIVIILFRCLT